MNRWLAFGLAFLLAANGVRGQSFGGRWANSSAESGVLRRMSLPLVQHGKEASAGGIKWHFAHRLQAGWEYDSNIYESSTRPIASGAGRFLLNTRGERRDERWQMQYAYAAVLQSYPGYGNENKLSHDLFGQAGVRLRPWLQFSTRANATLKLYLENVADYATTSGSVIAGVTLPKKILVELSAETGQLDYSATDFYDFTFDGLELAVRGSPRPNCFLETLINRRELRYGNRRALAYRGDLGLVPKPELQRDALTTWRVAATFGRKFLAQAALEAQTNRSNSFGYDFDRLRVSGLLGFRSGKRWMLRAAGMVQGKRYRDDLARLNLRDLDSEREQSNFVAVDLSRDFSATVSAMTRIAFYDNESTVPGVFYRKALYFAGLEIRCTETHGDTMFKICSHCFCFAPVYFWRVLSCVHFLAKKLCVN
jgi:hypothetical protein